MSLWIHVPFFKATRIVGSQLALNQGYICLIVFIKANMQQTYTFIKSRSNNNVCLGIQFMKCIIYFFTKLYKYITLTEFLNVSECTFFLNIPIIVLNCAQL